MGRNAHVRPSLVAEQRRENAAQRGEQWPEEGKKRVADIAGDSMKPVPEIAGYTIRRDLACQAAWPFPQGRDNFPIQPVRVWSIVQTDLVLRGENLKVSS